MFCNSEYTDIRRLEQRARKLGNLLSFGSIDRSPPRCVNNDYFEGDLNRSVRGTASGLGV